MINFFRGQVGEGSEAPLGGGPFCWGPLGMYPICPTLNPALDIMLRHYMFELTFCKQSFLQNE